MHPMRKIIRVGDPTSHSGTVISGSAAHTVGGKAIARQGDLVDCPAKYPDGSPHGVNPITEGEDSMPIDGVPVALEGMRTQCGCTLIGTGNATHGGDGTVPAQAAPMQSPFAGNMSPQGAFDQAFVITDPQGKPLVGYPYKITLETGEQITGLTGADGRTRKVTADAAIKATIEAPYYGHSHSTIDSEHGHEPCSC